MALQSDLRIGRIYLPNGGGFNGGSDELSGIVVLDQGELSLSETVPYYHQYRNIGVGVAIGIEISDSKMDEQFWRFGTMPMPHPNPIKSI